MHAQNFIVNQGSNWHTVKNILELFPETDTVPILTLVVESINTIDLSALVIAPQQEEVLLKLDFVGQQENDRLERLLASVNVVAEEEIVGLRWVATVLKQPQEVSELSVHVTYTRSENELQKVTYRRS